MADITRRCTSCGTDNEADARFCDGCGGSLARVCAACGVEARAKARFCRECGASLDADASPQALSAAGPVRRTVTVMFADLAGSTSFEERVDAETAREVVGRYHDLLRATAQRHRAGVTKYIGDGFMAVWGVPETGIDDAAHAVDAAVELQARFVDLAARVAEAHGVELALRVAVNTGEVVVGEGDADLVGDALNVGARLEAECPRGQVVVGEETWRSTRGQYRYDALGPVLVKGRSTPVAVFQWLGQRSESVDAAPFVGRADEIRRLTVALDEATVARAARMVTVIGDPGVGKTRLAAEFVAAHPSLRVIRTRCNVEETVALAPIVELLRSRELDVDIPVATPERDRILRDLNGLAAGVPGSVEETFWALRKFVEAMAGDLPLLIVFDDLQWADTLLFDLVEHLVEWVSDVPVLVVALARPELREVRADFVTVSRWVAQAVHLGGLDPAATAELAAEVVGGARLPLELVRRLPSSTGGNPLFVRELIGMLVDDEVLVEDPAGWRLTIDVDAITIPPTIHALLASRLERLDAVDRRVLEIASVLGTDFSLGAVSVLAGRDAVAIKQSLDRLRRLQLTQPSGVYLGDEAVWRFHHVLIRDVAYRRLLKSDRAELHERLADWVEAGGATLASDADEMVARHLESAHGYRLDLGTVGAVDLALRSARCYLASARRALDRDELASAGSQAARGAALATSDDGLRAELLLIGCEALLSAGDVVACAPLVDDLEGVAGDMLAPWATCYRCQFVVYTDPERLLEVDARLQEAIDEFGRRKDVSGLAKAHRVRAGARGRLGRIGESEADLLEALIAARQGGDQRQITAALSAAPSAALWGPSPVPKAGGRCLDVVRMQRMATAAPSLEATSLRHLAVLELLRGRPDKARSMLADARQIVADLGLRHGLMETELFAGIIESMVGDPVAAEPHFRTALEGLGALGVGADAGLAAALLARSLLAQGQVDDAAAYATESERLAGHNLKTAVAWRAVRSEILCAQGNYDDAVALARDAVAIAAGTDLVLDHADACLALGRVLTAAGTVQAGQAARRDAEALYAAKEVVGSIGRAAEPAPPAAPPPKVQATRTSRLPRTNRASEALDGVVRAADARDADAVVGCYSDGYVYDDRRGLSGDPFEGDTALREANKRIFEQYNHFEGRTLAVRGDRLSLAWSRWSDEAGNETAYLHVLEVDDEGRICYEGRFDEDDFEGAYRELDRRYYAGEGTAFALNGSVSTEWMVALNRGDFERAFGELTAPEYRHESRSRSMFGDRSAAELRSSFEELSAMVSSARSWVSTICWLSPTLSVSIFERDAVGLDGEHFTWTRLQVNEVRDGQATATCDFDPEAENEAFAYAEERVRGATRRLALTNVASETLLRAGRAFEARDVDGVLACQSTERLVYADQRALSGNPIEGHAAWRAAVERILEQYSHFEGRILAVRGERLALGRSRWSDDSGNETVQLHLVQVGDDGRITFESRFDEDDFESAYRELERRYYTGEGTAFAEGGAVPTEWMIAIGKSDFDRAFDELAAPEFRLESRSGTVFGDRSAAEVRASFEELSAMITSARVWLSAICWLSPIHAVSYFEREAAGPDGEQYAWTRLAVSEVRDGRLTSMCDFDPEAENEAFAYAEELVRASVSRLALSNRATEVWHRMGRAMAAHDVDGLIACISANRFAQDDRRGLSGDPIEGRAAMLVAAKRVFEQYSHFDARLLAVRGETLVLSRIRWSDDAGNETVKLQLSEVGDDGLMAYDGRFDEDDFEGAYRELDRRYYAGEGAAFAEAGAVGTEWMMAMTGGDLDIAFGKLAAPDFHLESRSGSVFGDRSAAEHRASLEELSAMVASARSWLSAISFLSPAVCVVRFEREAVGLDGEKYSWTRLGMVEIRDGRVTSMCDFDVNAEDEAFAYAEERVRATTSRLARTNRASDAWHRTARAMEAHDVDSVVRYYSDEYVYDDHRGLSGDPLEGGAGLRAAAERVLEQYPHIEGRVLAVRGQRLSLVRCRWSDDSGNETIQHQLYELAADGRIGYEGRFDEDDFEGAYRELERRYYASEGAAYAAGGAVPTEWLMAMNRGDLDRALGELTVPDFRLVSRSRTVFGDRSVAELRASFNELSAMVASARSWLSAVCWLSPNVCVNYFEREAVGLDGEHFSWTRLQVSELCDGRLTSMCDFDPDAEDDAFAYAGERVRAIASRLARTNRATELGNAVAIAMANLDVDAVIACCSDSWAYDDRRGLSGDPIEGVAAHRAAVERVFRQYSHFEGRTLAVRGERLALGWSRWSDESGNQTVHLHLAELGDDERIAYEARFDEDDFEGAYRELERRYYTGEGAAFAEGGALTTEFVAALILGDTGRAFGDDFAPEFRWESRSSSVFGDRSAEQLRASVDKLSTMVASSRSWFSAICWLSPNCCIVCFEREAVGLDGEQYSWAQLGVCEIRAGRVMSICTFDADDEAQAFAYADEKVQASSSRLALANGATDVWHRIGRAMTAHDIDAAIGCYVDGHAYDDRRGLSGDPIAGTAELRTAAQRIFEQYSNFEGRMLAVRGERLALGRTRWSDEAGNETVQFHVYEVGDDGLIVYEGRFDEDDFEGAYRELERRYFAGKGAEFAASGALAADYVIALNRGDLDRAFVELTAPDIRFTSRSRSVFGDRSAAEYRASFEELAAMVASARSWHSAVYWLSPTCAITSFVREAVGLDGEHYVWTRLIVCETRNGLLASLCEFEPDDEDAAFAYAEERMLVTVSRLAVSNRASEASDRQGRAMAAHDVDAFVAPYSDGFVYDDRRAWNGDAIEGVAAWRAGVEQVFAQYSHCEVRTLAVRGERLALSWVRLSDDAGNEAVSLNVFELDGDDRIGYYGRFDNEDFEGAYRELEQRYYAGEGAAFAEAGAASTDYVLALNRGDLDQVFGELTAPGFRREDRSRSLFGNRSLAEYRASMEELASMVASAQGRLAAIVWVSTTCVVGRFEREAVGSDGEQYSWTRLLVVEVRGGRVTTMCDFDPDDEEAAFAYAEELMRATPSRVAVSNRASEAMLGLGRAGRARDVDAMVELYSPDRFEYDDHRGYSGDPIRGVAELRVAAERVLQQFSNFDGRVLAVRDEGHALCRVRRSDDAGNESVQLFVIELGDDGLIRYEGRFDEDDFEGAYRELEQRYFAGKSAAFAATGELAADYFIAVNRGDLDKVFGELTTPDFHGISRSRSVFGDRSAAEFRSSIEELAAMVASSRSWASAVRYLSPSCCVLRMEREAVGFDGEQYSWARLNVMEMRDGQAVSLCEFDIEDEDAAFAYAEELVAARPSRLAVTTPATEGMRQWFQTVARDGFESAPPPSIAEQFQVVDRRAMPSAPCIGREAGITGLRRLLADYPDVDNVPLAVRGQHLALVEWRCRNPSGFEATYLNVHEVDENGLVIEQVRFDGDDFEGAYRELESRYYAGEGAQFAAGGALLTNYIVATNRGEFDQLIELAAPDFHMTSRSRSVFGDRSAAEVSASVEELAAMVESQRSWYSAVRWLSSACCVVRMERDAVGFDGEEFSWTKLYVARVRDGHFASLCEFELENEEAAFAYAEELVASPPSRLAVANLATEGQRRLDRFVEGPDFEVELSSLLHEQYRYVDRRVIPGAPVAGRQAGLVAYRRLKADYPDIEAVPLAVRGERLALIEWRCQTPDGFEAAYLNVLELDDEGQLLEHVRFDGDDFEGAYRELENRYYAGEGAAFAVGGALGAASFTAVNRGDLDRVFNELTAPDFRLKTRSRSVFGDRSAAEWRASMEELAAMVTSVRMWHPVVCWLSPSICVVRTEREAVGLDDEQYEWTKLYVNEVRDGRLASACEFELENEDEAFAYAEELVAAQPSRLAVSNLATERERRVNECVGTPEFDSTALDFMHEQFRLVDRRAMPGEPFSGRDAGLVHLRRLLVDYPDLDIVPLAVRGERLALVEYRGRTPGGYEATYLNVNEVDGSGQIVEQVRFDGDDFEGAYRELEQRYYAGEGSEFAAGGVIQTDFIIALNQGELDTVFGELTAPDLQLKRRSRSLAGDLSATEYRASLKELAAMVASARTWFSAVCWVSPTCCVGRFEREAIGFDGEQYSWTRVTVGRDSVGRLAEFCDFEPEDVDEAFAYAEELRART